MNTTDNIKGWRVREHSEEDLATEVHLGYNGTTMATNSENKWELNTMLAICLGPLALILLVSYIIHWIQVTLRIQRNIKSRRLEGEEVAHNKVSSVMTILTLQNERSGIFHEDLNTEEDGDLFLVPPPPPVSANPAITGKYLNCLSMAKY